LFREVEAEHCLVQREDKLYERPDIPGLTPRGFEKWATLMIQTHPDWEYERLQKAVLNMPISNPDNRKERFPKEIPQSLFPFEKIRNSDLKENIEWFIKKHCQVDLKEEYKKFKPHREGSAASSTDSIPSYSERERKPYQASVSTAVDDDEEETEIPSRPIERERKPYTAQPGGGKKYGEVDESTRRHRSSFSTSSIPMDGSASPEPRVSGSQGPDPTYLGASPTQHPMTTLGRSRSPSRGAKTGGSYRHSESDLLGYNGGSKYAGDDYYYNYGTTSTGDITEDSRRYRDASREEDQRLYESLRAEREKEREKNKYHDYLQQRSSWAGEEDYYRGALGSQGGPVGSSGGYDYKTYGYK
jgi:hypothetical protein